MEDHDAALLRALHDEYGDALFAQAVRLSGGDRQRAETLVQETLLRAWQSPDSLNPERAAVRAWLFTTVQDLARDVSLAQPGGPDPEADLLGGADDADRAVEAWTVAEALGRLSAAHREVLVECYYRGRSVAEAAARLGVPPGTVLSRTHYALRALRMALDELGVTG